MQSLRPSPESHCEPPAGVWRGSGSEAAKMVPRAPGAAGAGGKRGGRAWGGRIPASTPPRVTHSHTRAGRASAASTARSCQAVVRLRVRGRLARGDARRRRQCWVAARRRGGGGAAGRRRGIGWMAPAPRQHRTVPPPSLVFALRGGESSPLVGEAAAAATAVTATPAAVAAAAAATAAVASGVVSGRSGGLW